jgi:hypothetical protein
LETQLKNWTNILCISAVCATGVHAHAQTAPIDKQAARLQRETQGADAARNFRPGEGNPIPEAKPKISSNERAAASSARKAGGAAAAQAFAPGEGDPKPAATTRQPRVERRAERAAQRADVIRANKAGTIPSYGEGTDGTGTR